VAVGDGITGVAVTTGAFGSAGEEDGGDGRGGGGESGVRVAAAAAMADRTAAPKLPMEVPGPPWK
jgi:hypothetical protein